MNAKKAIVPLALVAGFGAGWYVGPGPAHRYCEECREIIALQARPGRTAVEDVDLGILKRKLERSEAALEEFRRQGGSPPDLHPECECLCHRYWIGPASRVHDGG